MVLGAISSASNRHRKQKQREQDEAKADQSKIFELNKQYRNHASEILRKHGLQPKASEQNDDMYSSPALRTVNESGPADGGKQRAVAQPDRPDVQPRKIPLRSPDSTSSASDVEMRVHIADVGRTNTDMLFDELNEDSDDDDQPVFPKHPWYGRRFWFLLTEHPSASVASRWCSMGIFLLIIVSSISAWIETLPSMRYPCCDLQSQNESLPGFVIVNEICMMIFCIEYVIRFISCGGADPWHDMELDFKDYPEIYHEVHNPDAPDMTGYAKTCVWFWKGLTMVDLIAVLPFVLSFLKLGMEGLVSLRYFRLVRVFRILKLQKQSIAVSLFVNTIKRSARPLGVLAFFVAMAVVVFGSIAYNLERGVWMRAGIDGRECGVSGRSTGCYFRDNWTGDDVEETPFTSVFVAMWWLIATVTTVGYGDIFPTTLGGRLMGTLAMLMGVIGFAMPITIIGNEFSDEFERLKAKEKASAIKVSAKKKASDARKAARLGQDATMIAPTPHEQAAPLPSPLDEESDPSLWMRCLSAWELDKFAKRFEDEGWDDTYIWNDITDVHLRSLGLKTGHILRFRQHLRILF